MALADPQHESEAMRSMGGGGRVGEREGVRCYKKHSLRENRRSRFFSVIFRNKRKTVKEIESSLSSF